MADRVNDKKVQLTLDEALQKLPASAEGYDSIWLSWATQIDDSDALYLLPDVYDDIARATGVTIPYVEVTCGPISIRLIGRASDQKSTPKFWHDNFAALENKSTKIQFARILDQDLRDPEMTSLWERSYKESSEYFRLHRKLVRSVGGLLNVDMDDHDLTKTNILHYALGYLWHWPGEKPADGDVRKEAAWAAVREGHLTQEDHHPEFSGGEGRVDAAKLFCDRLAVHLQKDADDGMGGWGIYAQYLPTKLLPQWHDFREKYGHINLRQALQTGSLPNILLRG